MGHFEGRRHPSFECFEDKLVRFSGSLAKALKAVVDDAAAKDRAISGLAHDLASARRSVDELRNLLATVRSEKRAAEAECRRLSEALTTERRLRCAVEERFGEHVEQCKGVE